MLIEKNYNTETEFNIEKTCDTLNEENDQNIIATIKDMKKDKVYLILFKMVGNDKQLVAFEDLKGTPIEMDMKFEDISSFCKKLAN